MDWNPDIMHQRIFIGSSTEALPIAEELQLALSESANITLWTNDVFRLSESALESLFRQLDRTDYAIFVLSSDDTITIRGKKGVIPRDNVLFELGLFSGRLGPRKTIVVHPDIETLRLPTDLLGVNTAKYRIGHGGGLSAALGPVSTRIKKLLSGQSSRRVVSWREYVGFVDTLIKKLKRPSGRGGFSFDTGVGISRGGIISADLIARHYGMNIPVVCLWADLHGSYPSTTFAPPQNWINSYVLQILADARVKNILLVNDITRTGATMALARKCLVDALPNKSIRTASLIVDLEAEGSVDYFGGTHETVDLQLPYYELG